MADAGRVLHSIVINMLDDRWRAVFIEELGDKRGPTAMVFAAGRTNDRLERR